MWKSKGSVGEEADVAVWTGHHSYLKFFSLQHIFVKLDISSNGYNIWEAFYRLKDLQILFCLMSMGDLEIIDFKVLGGGMSVLLSIPE